MNWLRVVSAPPMFFFNFPAFFNHVENVFFLTLIVRSGSLLRLLTVAVQFWWSYVTPAFIRTHTLAHFTYGNVHRKTSRWFSAFQPVNCRVIIWLHFTHCLKDRIMHTSMCEGILSYIFEGASKGYVLNKGKKRHRKIMGSSVCRILI